MSKLFEEMREVIAEELEVSKEEISRESQIVDDLGADSLDVVELIMRMEEKFSVEIPDEDAEKMQTVGDVLAFLEAKKL